MLEYLLFIIVLFFIAVLFYKQANEEFQILQLDAERLSELPTLYVDRSPIVVSGFKTPNLGTEEELKKRKIMDMSVLKKFTQVPMESAKFMAKESGLQVWFEHHLYNDLLPYTKWLYTFDTTLWPFRRGLFKSTACQTVVMPTQGTISVKLMLLKMLPYLPTKWIGRNFSSLTLHDTPLLNQLQYIEIRVRKGNLLFIPAHLIVDIDSFESSAWVFMAEIHHPISRLACLA